MEQIPSYSVIFNLLEKKRGNWELIKPILRLALLVVPGLAMESFDLMTFLGTATTLSDSADLLESGFCAIKTLFEKKSTDPMETLQKLRSANMLLVFSAYFDTLKQNNPKLWNLVELTGEESHNLKDATVVESNQTEMLLGTDGRAILPREGSEKLTEFYTLLSEKFRHFAEGLEGVERLRADWDAYPGLAVENYKNQYKKLQMESDVFWKWSTSQSSDAIHASLQRIEERIKRLEDRQTEGLESTELYLPPQTTMGSGRFQGRESDIATLDNALGSGNPIVLTGLGGIGKTELVAHFALRYRRDKRGKVYWATFDENFRNTIIRSMAPGLSSLPKEAQEETIYDLVMKQLRRCGNDDLLIIDNVEPYGNRLADPKDRGYKELCELPLNLILTTRLAGPGYIEIQQLDNVSLYQIFDTHQVDISKGEKDALIHAVDSHTMTIDLIARTLSDSCGDVTSQMILHAIEESKMEDVDYPEVEADNNPEQRRIDAHLRTLFSLSGLTDDAKSALCCATLLPANGLEMKIFRHSMEVGPQSAVKVLVKRGWIQLRDNSYIMHPVIRLVCVQELQPNDEKCGYFLDKLWEQYDIKKYDRLMYTQMAEIYSGAVKVLEDKTGEWRNNGGYLWNILVQSDRVRKLYEEDISMLESRFANRPVLADAYDNLGAAILRLGKEDDALELHLKALAIRQQVLPDNHGDISNTYSNMACCYRKKKEYRKALDYAKKAMEIQEENSQNMIQLAIAYDNVSGIYSLLGEYPEAKVYGIKALEIFEMELDEYHPDLAIAYANMGSLFQSLGEGQKSLEYSLKAMEIAKNVYLPLRVDISMYCLSVLTSYLSLGDYPKAQKFICDAISEMESYSVEPSMLIDCYSSASVVCLEVGDYHGALEYLLKVLDWYEQERPEEKETIAELCRKVGLLYGEMNDYGKSVDYLQTALSTMEHVYPKMNVNQAAICTNLGISLIECKDYWKGIEYLKRAMKFWEGTVPRDVANLVDSYKSIAIGYRKLENYDQSLRYYLKSLKIRENELSQEVSDDYYTVSVLYHKLGNQKDALKYMLKSVAIQEQKHQSNPKMLTYLYSTTGTKCYLLGYQKKALEYKKKAMELYREHAPEEYATNESLHESMKVLEMLAEMSDDEPV